MGGSQSAPVHESCHVVIVGAGYGGVSCAAKLDEYCKVTLIDAKDVFHHNVGALRSLVEPSFTKMTLIPYDKLFRFGTFKHGWVDRLNVSQTTVFLSSGEEVHFDYIVIACGSSVPFPGKLPLGTTKENAEKLYGELGVEVKEREKIVIIGGGPVGVELAGEIANDYPQKKVTIVHSREWLIDDMLKQKFLKKVHDVAASLNINLVLGEKVKLDDITFEKEKPWVIGPITLTTDKGTRLEADLVIKCTGNQVNSAMYRSSLSDRMEDGKLKVNRFLQVEEMNKVFAIGDCNNTPELKTAYVAGFQGEAAAENIKRLNQAQPLVEYKYKTPMMIVPLGRIRGVGQLPNGMVVGDFVCRQVKGKHLLAPRYWSLLKQEKPS